MSGSSCATTGSRTASSNPTTISSTIAVTLGTSSSISPGASCPSDCANGRTGSDQWELVLVLGRIRPRQRLVRQVGMRAAEVGRGRILAYFHDSAADRARAAELVEQRLTIAATDRARQCGQV